MASTLTTRQEFANVTVKFTTADGQPAQVDGVPVWATSNATVLTFEEAADGMSGKVMAGAPGTGEQVTITGDADLGAGVVPVIGILAIDVTLDPRDQAAIVEIDPGTATDKA